MPKFGSSAPRHPFLSLVYLFALVIVGVVLSNVMAIFVAMAFGFSLADLQAGKAYQSVEFLKSAQFLASIITFVVPAWLFIRLEASHSCYYFLKEKRVSIVLIFLAIAVIFAGMPVLEYAISLNKQLQLPGFLKGVEEWVRAMENQMADMTKKLLDMKTPAGLALNLLIIAVLPAIGEELIFRGCMLKIFVRWFKSYHVAIWTTAVIFSAIHMQFYGFLPRMLLGALLGYLFIWGKNIWLPITAHFANNAMSVLAVYIAQKNGASINGMDEPQSFAWYIYALSAVCVILILFLYFRMSAKNRLIHGADEQQLD